KFANAVGGAKDRRCGRDDPIAGCARRRVTQRALVGARAHVTTIPYLDILYVYPIRAVQDAAALEVGASIRAQTSVSSTKETCHASYCHCCTGFARRVGRVLGGLHIRIGAA